MKLLKVITPSKQVFDKTINDILQSPGYKHLKNPLTNYIENIKEALANFILKLLKKMFSNTHINPSIPNGISTGFLIIGILLLFAIIIFVVYKINKTLDKNATIKEIMGEVIEKNTTPKSLREKAAEYKTQGDFRQAVRYDYIALLLLMHNKSVIYLDETKTNQEILDYVKKNHAILAETLKYQIGLFNAAWYGHKKCSSEDYDKWNNNMEILWNEVISIEEKNE